MRCPACGSLVVREDAFCNRCGARLPVSDFNRDATPEDETPPMKRKKTQKEPLVRHPFGRSRRDQDVSERTIWRGTFSWKGLIREIGVTVVATITVVIAGPVQWLDPATHRLALLAVAVAWLALAALLLYRKLDVQYVLTNQRLIHQQGICTA